MISESPRSSYPTAPKTDDSLRTRWGNWRGLSGLTIQHSKVLYSMNLEVPRGQPLRNDARAARATLAHGAASDAGINHEKFGRPNDETRTNLSKRPGHAGKLKLTLRSLNTPELAYQPFPSAGARSGAASTVRRPARGGLQAKVQRDPTTTTS